MIYFLGGGNAVKGFNLLRISQSQFINSTGGDGSSLISASAPCIAVADDPSVSRYFTYIIAITGLVR